MIDPRVQVRVALYKNTGKVVPPIFVEGAVKLQNLAIFEIRVDHVQILIWPKRESAKFTKSDTLRNALFV
jgi:hypothetical protein